MDEANGVRRNGEGVDWSGGIQGFTPTMGSGGLGPRASGGPMQRIATRRPATAIVSQGVRPRMGRRYAASPPGRMTRLHRDRAVFSGPVPGEA